MNELALFAGAGGGILGGVLLGWHTVAAVELERYPRELLLQRQRDGILPPFPVWDDVRTFDGKPWRGLVDIVSGASPVKTLAQQGKGQELPAPAQGCGLKCTESFVRYDHATHSWRTPLCSLLEDSTEYSGTWPKQGIMLRGWCWELPTSVLRTKGIESGFWQRTPAGKHLIPTPTACNAPNAGSNTKGPKSLLEVARTGWKPGDLWPTPCSNGKGGSNAAKKWKQLLPTPTCQDAKNNGGSSQLQRNTPPLNAVAGGALNPPWVEWLMGWPIGWTDLKPLETDKFHSWLRSLSSLCSNALIFINKHERHT